MDQNENTNSKTVGYNMFWLVSRVNEGMATGKAIQWYIEDNSDDYPTFSANELNYVITV